LVTECINYFQVEEALKCHQSQESIEELFDRRKVNFNALFFAINSLMGLHMDLSVDQQGI